MAMPTIQQQDLQHNCDNATHAQPLEDNTQDDPTDDGQPSDDKATDIS
jgi:hypothetical protein